MNGVCDGENGSHDASLHTLFMWLTEYSDSLVDWEDYRSFEENWYYWKKYWKDPWTN